MLAYYAHGSTCFILIDYSTSCMVEVESIFMTKLRTGKSNGSSAGRSTASEARKPAPRDRPAERRRGRERQTRAVGTNVPSSSLPLDSFVFPTFRSRPPTDPSRKKCRCFPLTTNIVSWHFQSALEGNVISQAARGSLHMWPCEEERQCSTGYIRPRPRCVLRPSQGPAGRHWATAHGGPQGPGLQTDGMPGTCLRKFSKRTSWSASTRTQPHTISPTPTPRLCPARRSLSVV